MAQQAPASIASGDGLFKTDSFGNMTDIKGSKDGQFSTGMIGEASGISTKDAIMQNRKKMGRKGDEVFAITATQEQQVTREGMGRDGGGFGS